MHISTNPRTDPPVNARTNPRTRTDVLLLVAFCGFLFFYGLAAFGLLGADEPRYAQVAREMLARFDWVTPTLQGKPWLEKPVLYYWQAMLSFRLAGVSDWAARLPCALDGSLLIAAIYFFLRRLRPGSELDGALIAASCAGIIGFAHAAATDMPLAASFSIALLCWYAWYESESNSGGESASRISLAGFYFALALGSLAKGPVAPALAGVIIVSFVALRRDWRALARTLWIPGIALYLVVTLPWYVAVQLRNPGFFRFFILEHNLARFSQDVYHHRQPFWFYLPVFLLAMMPWSFVLVLAVAERIRIVWTMLRRSGKRPLSGREDSWPLFLFTWMLVPILFFSISQSKLPGYILPAVPAGSLLVADYLAGRRTEKRRFSAAFAAAHGLICAALVFTAFSATSITLSRRVLWNHGAYVSAAEGAIFAVGIAVALVSRAGLRVLTRVTLFAVAVSVAAIIRFAAPAIDATQSARPVAERIQLFSPEPLPVAIYHINRAQEYGLEFYLNLATPKYEDGNIPAANHVLVAPPGSQSQVALLVAGRRVSYLTSVPAQKLELYWVK
jgi:4-amino-4-deoxy-L-arabinose transferase-like glycosyltransferase